MLCIETMSSNRNRAPRGGARGNGQDPGEEMHIWNQSQDDIGRITRLVARMEEGRTKILKLEADMAAKSMLP